MYLVKASKATPQKSYFNELYDMKQDNTEDLYCIDDLLDSSVCIVLKHDKFSPIVDGFGKSVGRTPMACAPILSACLAWA
jgi:hypothetical protein